MHGGLTGINGWECNCGWLFVFCVRPVMNKQLIGDLTWHSWDWVQGLQSPEGSIGGDREWIDAPPDRRMKNKDLNTEAFNI